MADIRINALATTATTPASDDYLALDGAAQGTRKILATNIANNVTDVILGSSGPSVKSTLSARAPRQGLVFDGTAAATASGVSAVGSSAFTYVQPVRMSVISGTQMLISGSAAIEVYVAADGTLTFQKAGGTAITSTGVVVAGKNHIIAYTKSGSAGTWYIDGIAAGGGTDNNNYTGTVTAIGGRFDGTFFSSAALGTPLIYNRALSASEVVSLYESGAPAGADYGASGTPASNTSLITGADSTFSAGYTWNSAGSVSITGGEAVWTGGGAISNPTGLTITAGKKYRVTIDITQASTNGWAFAYGGGYIPSGITGTGVKSYEFTATATGGFGVQNGDGPDGKLTSITLLPIGLLLAPDAAQAGGGYVWNDQSGNLAQIVLPSSGVQWALPSVAGQRIRGTTSTNGNQQLLGASVLLPAECQITHVRARARSGTPTITIGTASGGAQIVASVALSTTWLNCTIALTGGIVSSADDIWVGSNSTDVVETDIAFQPLDF